MQRSSIGFVLLTALYPSLARTQHLVDLSWQPANQVVVVGSEVRVDLVATSDGPLPQSFGGLDAILSWDPSVLQFLGHDASQSPYTWFAAGFLPDPDGINADLGDGDALFTALAQIVTPAMAAPSPGLLVTTMRFTALSETSQTLVSFVPDQGAFGSTRVIDFFQPGLEITGDISSQAAIRIVDAPAAFCTAKVNSLGCLPSIDSIGTPSATSPAPFTITAHTVLNFKNGLFFYGYLGPAAIPFFGGTLCTVPPLRRAGLQNSGGSFPPANDCSGSYAIAFNALIQGGTDFLLVPGQEIVGQFWSRDPLHVDGTGVGLTDAIQFVITD